MFGLGLTELLVILLLVLLVFGARRIPVLGQSIGVGIRNFLDGIRGKEAQKPLDQSSDPPKNPG